VDRANLNKELLTGRTVHSNIFIQKQLKTLNAPLYIKSYFNIIKVYILGLSNAVKQEIHFKYIFFVLST